MDANSSPITYYDQIISNLRRFQQVALLHPRLAMVGIESEFEIMIQEIVPPEIFKEIVSDNSLNKQYDPRYPETTTARQALRSIIQLNYFSKDMQDSIREILRKGGDCRHSRAKATYDDVIIAIEQAIRFVDEIGKLGFENAFICAEHNWHRDFVFEEIFITPIGEPYVVFCPDCLERQKNDTENPVFISPDTITSKGFVVKAIKKPPKPSVLFYWEIPNPDESSGK
jgi:hypothetical protein